MPKKPMDYSKTIIYKIVCNDLNIKECYVGHTTDFKSRKYNHKQSVENINHKDYNSKKSTFIREHGKWSNWSMIQIETYECNNLQEAIARERYWYEILGSSLNSNVPSRSKKEYSKDNKEYILKKSKEYLEQNKEQIKEKKKQHYEDNKEEILEKRKDYYEKNKEKIQMRKSTKFECKCGSILWQCNKHNHFKTLKHCEFIQNNI